MMTHSKCLNVVDDPVMGYSEQTAMARSYGVLKPGRGKIDVCLRNHSAKQITFQKQTAVGEVKAANIILGLLALKQTGHEPVKGEATTRKRKYEGQKGLLDKIYLTGLGEWSKNKQKEVQELITEYTSIFPMSDIDLGKTSLVKYSIWLTDNIQLKECYQQIPPSMYENVREHLKEMLEIGTMWPPHSLLASPVTLVPKKDGKLQFCIHLRRLNADIIKDSYSLLRIEDTLDSLNGDVWFTALDLKSGYWQVKVDEASKPLMAFMVGPLESHKCDHMPF